MDDLKFKDLDTEIKLKDLGELKLKDLVSKSVDCTPDKFNYNPDTGIGNNETTVKFTLSDGMKKLLDKRRCSD